MRRNSLVLLTCALAVLAAGSGRLTAQGPPPGGPPPRFGPGGGFGPGPQDGIDFLGFGAGISTQVVTGTPYSAQVVTEHTATLADGNQIDRKTTMNVYRDGQGRTRRELTLPAIGSYTVSGAPPMVVFINDPVAGVAYVLDPANKTAHQFTLPAPRPPRPNNSQPQQGNADPVQDAVRNALDSALASVRNSSTTSLGSKTIEGVLAEGTQVTRTIPAGRIGNAQPIHVVSTRWYSSELKVNVRTETNDPAQGNSVTSLTNINRSEPDPTLFQLPADYTLQTANPRKGRRPGLGAPPPPQ
jgi:hypothetical protein